jgi:class 3 adenylate cyclase
MSFPGGTVTLLFSDVEGSTRLVQQLGDDYAGVEAEHRRIMREACTGAGGHEIDRQGDSFFFSFPRARDAVAGALAGQRALAAHQWPDGVEVKVRMGLHTGEPSVGEEGYLGLDVIRAARIGAAAHGGQILVSETTRALLSGSTELKDLGEHRLKGMEQPERLYQVVADDLPATFPAPRADASPAVEDELSARIESYVEKTLVEAFEGGVEPFRWGKRTITGPRGATAKLRSLVSLLLALALGLIAIAWLIKVLFF